MTREEAIKAFRGLSGVLLPREYYREAIQMAIEALGREPIEDVMKKQVSSSRSHENVLISKQAAKLKVARVIWEDGDSCDDFHDKCVDCLDDVPSAQPDTSRIENILHGKSPEEQYDFLWWLMQSYGMQFSDTRIAVIEWLRGERNG